MVKAYVLVQSGVGKIPQVAEALKAMPAAVQCDEVTGPYDVVVLVEVPAVEDLGRLVAEQIQTIDGITRTVTCPVVNY
ncbi:MULTISPECIES: Lrp/AsnC ligand binding domain-containing protein [unclassified Luteococcus]|uniref:Lrp/AsnC ligand binding domain-containing protein n=1 Tax=unclassified Luteococcus TaxID=2639923 RepID=UPI00313BD396